VIATPILLRRNSELAAAGQAQDRLVILTPHNETIRSEFGEAFARYWKEKTGRTLYIDWRIPGGTSDIARVIDSSYKAADEIKVPGIGVDLFFGGGEPDFKLQADKGSRTTSSPPNSPARITTMPSTSGSAPASRRWASATTRTR
jgi:iron(III) transport system substrate-binding protein